MDYNQKIIELVEKINNQDILKRIYELTQHLYVRQNEKEQGLQRKSRGRQCLCATWQNLGLPLTTYINGSPLFYAIS